MEDVLSLDTYFYLFLSFGKLCVAVISKGKVLAKRGMENPKTKNNN